MAIPVRAKVLVFGLALLALAAGIAGRAAHLDRKLFWQDESATALRVSGHGYADLYPLFDGKPHPVAAVRELMERDPATDAATVVRTLAKEDPHHAPLFYVLDRFALDAIGGGAASTYRLPSVAFGCLAIWFAFLLGSALYRSKLAGAMLAAFVAVSPLHVLYARQAREYALFTCVVFASSFVLVRALEGRRTGRWIAYAATIAVGLYTDPIFALVIVAHAFAAFAQRRVTPRIVQAYAVATVAGAATFAPWALNAIRSKGSIEGQLDWGASVFPLTFLAEKWAFNIAAVFFDAEFADLRLGAVAALVLAVVAIAFAAFVRRGDPLARSFALPLTLVPIGFFVVLDLARGSHFSTIPRYLTAGWIGFEIAVTGALAAGLSRGSRIAQAAFAFLVLAGVASAAVDVRAENWWDNNNQVAYQAVARTIDATSAPLVLDDGLYEVALMLARYVRPDATLLLFHAPPVPSLPAETAHAFLVVPSARTLAAIEAHDGGAYAIRNVSPNVTNAISHFHDQLSRDRSYAHDDERPERPENALWSLDAR